MNLRLLLISAVAVSIGAVQAVSIDHDKVQPFAQPEPVTDAEKAAIRFKPELRIEDGCNPYPAVNAAGETSAGLKGTGYPSDECEGSNLGSQVYGRAVWYRNMWAIMYAWYFPKEITYSSYWGHRHSWMNVVVWIDNPAIETPTATGVSTSTGRRKKTYLKYNQSYPVSMLMDEGTHFRVKYDDEDGNSHILAASTIYGGDSQDLIMWEQLTDDARRSLNETDFGKKARVPFINANFEANLELAWPF